ncbi:MAG: hypothetical protein AAGB31_16655 [Bdellovibrio sp.]
MAKFSTPFLTLMALSGASLSGHAALPPQFSECLTGDSAALSSYDVHDIAKVAKVTYCQNQMGITNKTETLTMLKNKNIQIGISIAKTSYSREDLLELARAGSYALYVDSNRIAKEYLPEIAKAGAQLIIISSTSGLAATDLRTLVQQGKPFVYNVNSNATKEDLKSLVSLGVEVVIRSSQVGLSKEDIMEIARVNTDSVTILP